MAGSGIKSKRTAIKAPWQNPYAERVIGTLRRELLDYMIPVNERHLEYLLGEYVHKYYNTCLLYTSDAADDLLCVDLGGRRIIKKKKRGTSRIL